MCNFNFYISVCIYRTEFILDEGGDVSWKIAEEAEPLPFFNCETYEVIQNDMPIPFLHRCFRIGESFQYMYITTTAVN